MDETYLTVLFNNLKSQGINTTPGLTNEEIRQIEEQYTIIFPQDLAAFLRFKLPISDGFPNWREGSEEELIDLLDRPLQGINFDIEHNNFWLSSWGEKPKSLHDSFEVARYQVSKAPKLIPIYKHRYIPSEPMNIGNPVYSVWQTDIIYYGFDLEDYFNREFGVPMIKPRMTEPRPIRFWEEIVG